jgi:hypothetical protein
MEPVAPGFARAQGNGLVPQAKGSETFCLKLYHFVVEFT